MYTPPQKETVYKRENHNNRIKSVSCKKAFRLLVDNLLVLTLPIGCSSVCDSEIDSGRMLKSQRKGLVLLLVLWIDLAMCSTENR